MKIGFLVLVLLLGSSSYASAQQGITCETWTNTTIPGGDPQSLADNPTLLGNPTTTETRTTFEAPVNTVGTFVRRCRAQINTSNSPQAFAAGNYTFWVATNGVSKLWLSTNQIFKGKTPIARMMQSVAPTRGLYTRYAEQKSALIPLSGGQTQYLMLIYQDSVVDPTTNLNHASLRWTLPNGTMEGPVPGSRFLLPAALTTTATLAATPTTLTGSGNTTLNWTCNGTATSSASPSSSSWTGVKNASGSQQIALTATTTFTLSCDGPGGLLSRTATVNVSTVTPTGTVRLYWDPNSETDLSGYVLVYGSSSGVYTQSVTLAKTTNTHQYTGLSDGTYYFAVRAFNASGLHSAYSNEVRVIMSGGTQAMSQSTQQALVSDPMTTQTASARTVSADAMYTDSGSSAVNEVLLVKSAQDNWIEDPLVSGWKLGTGWSWDQSVTKDPIAIVSKDWVLSTLESKILPGPLVTQDQVLAAPQGNRYWTSLQYVPETGYSFGSLRKPNATGFINGVRLIWFYHIHVDGGFAKFYPVAAVAALENNAGYVIYSRDDRGVWQTTTTQVAGKFELVLPDLMNWVRIQNVLVK